MKSKSTIFLVISLIFFGISGFFGAQYFVSDMQKQDVSKLLLFFSNLLLGVAMIILSRNKAFRK